MNGFLHAAVALWLGMVSLVALAGSDGAAVAAARPAPATPALPEPLQAQLQQLLAGSAVRGAAVVLVDANGPTGAWFYGQADTARGVAVTPDTCFRAGSVSKTFTAMLAQRLADVGLLDLDAPLPADLQPPVPPGERCGPVTVAQLLEHTGGIAGSTHADYGAQQPDAPVAAAAARVARRELRWCPGQHYSYANDGSTLAAAAIERAGGADFDTLMQREVFAPLGMKGATFATGTEPACLARSYDADGRSEVPRWQLPVRPAGALVATPLELARAVQMLLAYGRGHAGHLLEPCSVAHMGIGTQSLAGRSGAAAGVYGRGLFRFVAAGRLMSGHWGRIDGFQTTIGFAPEIGRGIVIMVNTADRRTMHALREAVAEHLWQGSEAPVFPPAATPAEGIAGWYANAGHDMPLRAPWVALFDVVRIEPYEEGLMLRALWPWVAPRQVQAVSETAFRDPALHLPSMAFARDAQGRRWWMDGESYAEVSPEWAIGKVLVLATGTLALLGVLAVALWRGARRMLLRGRSSRAGTSQRSGASAGIDAALFASALGFAGMFGGYVAFGLLATGDLPTQLGRPGALAIGLAACSVIAAAGAGAALLQLARRGGKPMQWFAACACAALAGLCAANGWLPLSTWTAS